MEYKKKSVCGELERCCARAITILLGIRRNAGGPANRPVNRKEKNHQKEEKGGPPKKVKPKEKVRRNRKRLSLVMQ